MKVDKKIINMMHINRNFDLFDPRIAVKSHTTSRIKFTKFNPIYDNIIV